MYRDNKNEGAGYSSWQDTASPYGASEAGGRPSATSKEDKLFVREVIGFATKEATEVWNSLGLDKLPIPKVVMGAPQKDAWAETQFSINTGKPRLIVLKKALRGKWTKVEYAQAFIFEMGNVKNSPAHFDVFERIDELSKLEFVRAIEQIEWEFLDKLLTYISRVDSVFFGKSIWTDRPKSFDDYFENYAVKHRRAYEAEWENYHR